MICVEELINKDEGLNLWVCVNEGGPHRLRLLIFLSGNRTIRCMYSHTFGNITMDWL